MTETEYRHAMHDLVNFLQYVSEPAAEARKSMGVWVLGFLLLLFVCVWFLNREYWRGIH